MGALHEGHLSLVRAAAAECDEVVVSIFVNPAQFNDVSDLQAYPRDEQSDLRLAESAGATVVFAPPVDEVYPAGSATTVHVGGVSEPWEGASRGPGHFAGVALVVSKLLNMVGPDAAWFGEKDAQQVAVVRRLSADLNIPARIMTGPTIREPDGLAMSSRNVRLSWQARQRALSLHEALSSIVSGAAAGIENVEELCSRGRRILAAAGVEPEYLAVVDSRTFDALATLSDREAGTTRAIVAAEVGGVRLIDNEPW
jgi:pantoate--beta-alanine ligase